MPSIKLPREFFEKERREAYSSWRPAFWRELLANSLDAGARHVRITVENGHVAFVDDGLGMSRYVAEEVYLSIGRSTKGGDGQVGGFGRARVLTCFSMDRYEIEGKNYLIQGSGAEYEIKPSQGQHVGLAVRVWASDLIRMQDSLTEVLEMSYLPGLRIYLNGEEMFPAWRYPAPETVDMQDDMGQAGAIESHADLATIRVSGLAMFQIYTGVRKGILVELDATKSRDLLNANRDGPKPALQHELNRLAKELNANDEALTTKAVSLTAIEVGTKGARKTKPRMAAVMAGLGIEKSPQTMVRDSSGRLHVGTEINRGSGITIMSRGRSWKDAADAVKAAQTFQNFNRAFLINSSDARVIDEAQSWRQENWGRLNRDQLQLLVGWDVACECAVQCICDVLDMENEQWATGLTFCGAVAQNHMIEDTYYLCLNPIQFQRHCAKMSEARARKELLATALHETVHIFEDQHDEKFAATLTMAMGELDQAWALRAIGGAQKTVQGGRRG